MELAPKASKNTPQNESLTHGNSSNPVLNIVSQIKKAETFAEILELTERFDFDNSEDPSIKKLGKSTVVNLLWTASFVNSEAYLGYLMYQLRENALNTMKQHGLEIPQVELRK